jgi:hypothetical protein
VPNLATTNLTSGEISPAMLGRADVARFGNGCRVLENFLLASTGMWSYRPGMRLMGMAKFADRPALLRRFQFSDQQGYILEIGDLYIRIWHPTGQVVSGGPPAVPVEVATVFPVAELGLLGFAQSADFLIVVHEQRGIFSIRRSSHTTWSFVTFDLVDGPYGKENVDVAQTLTLSAVVGAVTVTATGHAPFGPGDEGRIIRVKDGIPWRWLIINSVTSSTVVQATLQGGALSTITAGTPFVSWRLGLYSNRLGWPATAKLHEQSLVLTGSFAAVDRIDGSAAGDYVNFVPGVNAGDAWSYTLGTDKVNRIIELAIANELIAFTTGSEHRVAGDSTGARITPTAIWQKPIGPQGTKRIEPLQVGDNSIAFVDKVGLNIQALTFDFRFSGYGVDNLTLLADHIAFLDDASKGFQALAWQGNPIGTIWTIRGNGELAGCLYKPGEQILGWHRHPMGSAAGEQPYVESVETVTGPTHDEVWALVRRDLPGGPLRTIERMDRPGLWYAPPESRMCLDCGLSLRNTPTATLTPGATSGTGVVFTLSNVTGGFAFVGGDVGRFLKYRYLSGWTRRREPKYVTAIAKITGWTSATQITADILVPFPSTAPLATGAWGLTVSTINGLGHFEGLGVWIVSDGRVFGPRTVVGGAVALDVPGWEVHAGLKYDGYLVSMPLDTGPQPAVGQGRQTRIDRMLLRVLNSVGGEVAALPETEAEVVRWNPVIPYTQGTAAPQAAPIAVSKDHYLPAGGDWTRRPEVALRQSVPLPFNCSLLIEHAYAPWVQP